LVLKLDEWNLFLERTQSNEFQLCAWTKWHQNAEDEFVLAGYGPSVIGAAFGQPYELWERTRGAQGLPPPPWFSEYLNFRAGMISAGNEEEFRRWGGRVWQWLSDHLPVLGTVAYPAYPAVVSNRLRNVWPWNRGVFENELMVPQWYLEE
jgi:hypothetical protein